MQQWQYKIEYASDNPVNFKSNLDIAGKEGWELVSTIPHYQCQLTFIYKRPIKVQYPEKQTTII